MLNDRQAEGYLKRIGYVGAVSSDKDTLDGLVYAHQCSVPFETVSVHRGGTPSLDVGDLYGKVVERKLGGYCFELNKLFGELLCALGFATRPVLSRAVRGRAGRMPINHRGIIVELPEGAYSVDVGFGGPMPAGALRLQEGSDQLIDGETFAAKDAGDSWWRIERLTRAAADAYDDEAPVRRQVELELCTAAAEEQDFELLNEHFSQQGTLFRDHEIVNLRTPDGYLGYKDGVLTVRRNGRKELRELHDRAAIDKALAEAFGLEALGTV